MDQAPVGLMFALGTRMGPDNRIQGWPGVGHRGPVALDRKLEAG